MISSRHLNRRDFIAAGLGTGAALASTALIPGTAAARGRAEFNMVFASTFSEATEQYVVTGVDLFKQLAEKYCQGRLSVDLHLGGKLGGQNVLPQKVQQGSVQACQLSMQNFTPFAESFNILDFPYLFPSNDAFERFLEQPDVVGTALGREPASKGLHILGGMWANTGFRVLALSKKLDREVRVPADLKGVKVRVTSSKVEQQAFSLTPGNSVSVNWAEAYLAMQQGAVDALHVGLGPLTSARIHETIGTATRLNMSFNAHVTAVSKRWFDRLPADVREGIERAARESWAFQKREQRKADDLMWAQWREAGIKVLDLSPDEHRQWVDIAGHQRPQWDQWKSRYGSNLYDRILKSVSKVA